MLLLEAVLRYGFGFGTPVLSVADPACGYVVAPNQDVRRLGHRNRINAYSMRSPDVSPTKDPGTLRVLFVGDSVTYGTSSVDQSDIFTSILSRELPAIEHRPVEVLNASAGGWAVSNELGYVRSRGIFQSDLVVFVLNTDDLAQPFSMFTGMPRKRPACAIWEAATVCVDRVRNSWAHPAGPAPISADAGATPEAGLRPQDATPRVLAALADANQIARGGGARFAIVYIPSHGGAWDGPEFDASLQMLRAWCVRRGVPLADLTGDLALLPRQQIYYDGIHLHAAGDLAVAHAVERHWAELRAETH